MMRNGKHRGRTFQDITSSDRPYCAWVLRVKPAALQRFHAYLREEHGGILEVGRYRNRFFDEVLDAEPTYCSWAPSHHQRTLQV